MKTGSSGYVRSGTGIGVVQHYLYPRLRDLGHELVLSPGRDLGRRPHQVMLGLVRGFIPPRKAYQAFLSIVPPLPVLRRAPTVTVIYDLRWLRTKEGLGRAYRGWDLRRTVKRSAVLMCISQHTADELAKFDPSATRKSTVALLGPGMIDRTSMADGSTAGNVILIGGAPHKRNEFAAKALSLAQPSWCDTITGVGLSQEARTTLENAFGAERCNWLQRPSDEELVQAYASAETFVFLGMDEGFGLPYIEALSSGCRVVAIDQPLTREILGEAATLLQDEDVESVATRLQHLSFAPADICTTIAAKYDWDIFASAIDAALRHVAGPANRTRA